MGVDHDEVIKTLIDEGLAQIRREVVEAAIHPPYITVLEARLTDVEALAQRLNSIISRFRGSST